MSSSTCCTNSHDGRRTAEAAQAHFVAAGDETGAARAAVLRALNEFNIAAGMGADVPRAEQRALLDTAVARTERAQAYFEAHELHSDAMNAMLRAAASASCVLGDYEPCVPVYQAIRARAHGPRRQGRSRCARPRIWRPLAVRRGNAAQSVEMFDAVLPLIERDRNPDLYATLIGNLGYSLITLGEFDRALRCCTPKRWKSFPRAATTARRRANSPRWRSIQFRSGNVERALATIENALPLYERAQRPGRAGVGACASRATPRPSLASTTPRSTTCAAPSDRTRTASPSTGRACSSPANCARSATCAAPDKLLTQALLTKNEPTRADALAERARLREKQRRSAEALADLREADAIYARLKLDFNRIDTSSALALALLAAGDMAGAGAAADTAVAIETRIRVNSANPELRARFLSASYAPYEARIEVDLAAGDA